MEGHEASPVVFFGMACVLIVGLSIFAVFATRGLKRRPSGRLQGLLEMAVSSLDNFVTGIIGPKGRKYTPFIGTMFIFILSMNLLGLVPGFKSPTSNLSITLSLSIITFLMYNFAGIRETGFLSWVRHLLGDPIWLAPLMFPIHLIGELARPVSLSIRLFGNIFGEETVIAILAGMSLFIIKKYVAIPYQFPMMVFGVFTAFVQALVFSMLSAIYISVAIEGAHGHEDDHSAARTS